MKIDDIILTDHAIARAEEIGITEEDAKKLLCSSQRQKDSWRRSAYKVFKYGDKQCDVEYYRKLVVANIHPYYLLLHSKQTNKNG